MAKKSVVVIFAVLFLAVSYAQFRLDTRSAQLKGYEILMVKRERDVRLLEAMAVTLFSLDRIDIVEGHLNDAIRVNWIDFYMVTYKGQVMTYNSVSKLSDRSYETLRSLHPPGKFWYFDSQSEQERSIRGPASESVDSNENFRFIETDLGNHRRLKLGFRIDREAFLASTTEYTSQENRRIFVLTLLIAFGIFLFSARDLLKVAKAIRTKGIRGLKEIRTLSKEASAIQHGLEGFGETVDRLAKQNRTLSAQVLPSLRSELRSGKTPPYEFDCTMVRTDINGFTQIFHNYPVEEFLETINQFFKECSHIISRFDGFIHEFVGDEIIFYFKDDDHERSFTAALSCAAEIEKIASRIHEQTSTQRGYAFRIKSSLAHGKIRFGPLLNGFSLAGAPLIETTRILSSVSEKEENTIHFDSRHVSLLSNQVDFAESFKASLKGMEGERTLMRYLGHKPLQTDSTSVADYRSDHQLDLMLRWIATEPETAFAQRALSLFAKLKVTNSTSTWIDTLEQTIRSLIEMQKPQGNRALATLTKALPHLIPAEYVERMTDLFLLLMNVSDKRVVANAIEALQGFRDLGKISPAMDRNLMNSGNNRLATNSLIYVGTDEITPDVNRRIRKLLDSSDAEQVKAGIFAWGEIAQHYLKTDAVYYRTQEEFLNLARRLEAIAAKSPELAKHATQAAAKAGDQNLSKRLSTRASA